MTIAITTMDAAMTTNAAMAMQGHGDHADGDMRQFAICREGIPTTDR